MRAKNSAIFIGGIGSNEASMEIASEWLSCYFEDVTPIPFREAINDRMLVDRMKGRPIITHSAGLLAVKNGYPESAHAFNPPVPTTEGKLIKASVGKSWHMLRRNRQEGDVEAVKINQKQSAKEILAHPVFTLDSLGSIAAYNSLASARFMSDAGILSTLVWTHDDDFFQPHPDDIAYTEASSGARIHLLPGEHDELLIRPEGIIKQVFEGLRA